MSISDELTRLQALHESGALTDTEFADAKAKVLAGETEAAPSPSDSALHQEVAQLKIQNDLIRLEQDWEQERQSYMIRGRYGNQSVPNTGSSILAAVVLCALGLFMIIAGSSMKNGSPLPIFGVIIIIVGVVSGISGASKASQYQEASDRYEQRRSELQSQLDTRNGEQNPAFHRLTD